MGTRARAAARRVPAAVAAAALALGLAGSGTARAALAETDYAEVNAAIVEGHVLPRMAAFERSAARLDAAMAAFCAGTGPGAEIRALLRRYHETMDAWMAVRHLNFGPAEEFMRASRIQFAPDPEGRVPAAVARLLTERGGAAFEAEAFTRESVAAQGLPALEHVLFGDDGRPAFTPGFPDPARCRLGRAIARNIMDMAEGMAADWQRSGGFAHSLTHPGESNSYFATHKDAAIALFRSLHGGFDVLVALKIEPPLGKSAAAARPDLVESRLSGRGIANIVLDLEALSALYRGESGKPGLARLLERSDKDPELAPLMRRAFAQTLATARTIAPTLTRAVVDPAGRPRVEKLHLQLRALRQIIAERLAPALGIAAGFNALDGD
jgi:hypothetical protein